MSYHFVLVAGSSEENDAGFTGGGQCIVDLRRLTVLDRHGQDSAVIAVASLYPAD